jgi:hypothetical protein
MNIPTQAKTGLERATRPAYLHRDAFETKCIDSFAADPKTNHEGGATCRI